VRRSGVLPLGVGKFFGSHRSTFLDLVFTLKDQALKKFLEAEDGHTALQANQGRSSRCGIGTALQSGPLDSITSNPGSTRRP
jgi:hypothetical protein